MTPCISRFRTTQKLGRVPEKGNPQDKLSGKMARVTPCISCFRTTQKLGRIPETRNPQGNMSEKIARVTPCISCFQTTQKFGRIPETQNPQGKLSTKNGESDARDTEPARQIVRTKIARVTPCISCFRTTQKLGRVPETQNPQNKLSMIPARGPQTSFL